MGPKIDETRERGKYSGTGEDDKIDGVESLHDESDDTWEWRPYVVRTRRLPNRGLDVCGFHVSKAPFSGGVSRKEGRQGGRTKGKWARMEYSYGN